MDGLKNKSLLGFVGQLSVPFSVLYMLCFFFSLLGTLAGWNCCCGASKIAQTAHTVCFMVVFSDRLDV